MSKKTVVKCITVFVFASILLAFAVLSNIYLCSEGTNYTEEYNVYKQVKDVNTLEQARKKLQDLKLEYTITDKTLTLSNYSHVCFSLSADGTCNIIQDDYMSNFQKLDEEDLSVAEVHGIAHDDKIIEKVTITTKPDVFTKLNNHYFVKNQGIIIACVFGYIAGILLLLCSTIGFIAELSNVRSKTNAN